MNFLDMGFGEILLIIVVAIIIWGPGKIPEIARNLGKMLNTLRKTSSDVTTQIKREFLEEEKESRALQKKPNDDTAGKTDNDAGDTGTQSSPDKQAQ